VRRSALSSLRRDVLDLHVKCAIWLTLDDLDDHDAGSKASIKDTFGNSSGRLPASTPTEATAVLRRPMVWTRIWALWKFFRDDEVAGQCDDLVAWQHVVVRWREYEFASGRVRCEYHYAATSL